MFTDTEEINILAYSQRISQPMELGLRNKVYAIRSTNDIDSCITSAFVRFAGDENTPSLLGCINMN